MKHDSGGWLVGVVTPSLFAAYRAAILLGETPLMVYAAAVERINTSCTTESQTDIDLLSSFFKVLI